MSRPMIQLRSPQEPQPAKINREITKHGPEHRGFASYRIPGLEIPIARIVDLKFRDLKLSVWEMKFEIGKVALLLIKSLPE